MMTALNYVISPFMENIETEDPQRVKLYLRAAKNIEKEADELYV